jgi:hypothetical protein
MGATRPAVRVVGTAALTRSRADSVWGTMVHLDDTGRFHSYGYRQSMEWVAALGIPLAGVLGGLLGVWIGKRSARRSDVTALLVSQLQALYSEHPRARQAARDIIRDLMLRGDLSREQLEAASTALRNWAAVSWERSDGAGRSLVGRDDGAEVSDA